MDIEENQLLLTNASQSQEKIHFMNKAHSTFNMYL